MNGSSVILLQVVSKTLNGYLLVDCFWSGIEAGKFFPYGKKKKKHEKIKCEKELAKWYSQDPRPDARLLGLHAVIISVGAHFIWVMPTPKLVNWERISWIPKDFLSGLILPCSFPSCWAVHRYGFFSVVSYRIQWSPFSPFQMPRNACFLKLVTFHPPFCLDA